MNDRGLNHFCHIGTVFRRTGIFLAASRKTYLIINYEMNASTRFVGAGLRHLERFHHHTLASKRRIAVDNDRDDLVALWIFPTVLTRSGRAHDYRRGNFQVGGVES